MMRPATPLLIALAAALLLSLILACGTAPTATPSPAPTQPPAPTPRPTDTPAPPPTEASHPPQPSATPEPGATPLPTDAPAPTGSTGESEPPTELNVILATTVLEVGTQRVAFLLVTPTGLVKEGNRVSITPIYLPDNTTGPSIPASFHQWPYGVRGAFAAQVNFDRPGPWRLDITSDGPDSGAAAMEIEVAPDSPVPFIGTAGPPSESKTLAAVGDLALLTTDYTPDPALYQVSIREAMESPLPAVVVFASPAFCTTATCGPQVDAVSELRETYDGQAHFIHIEIYDNPDEIQGDLDRARIAPAVEEWGLTSLPHWFNESWTFVLDSNGQVQARFEGFATVAELDTALQAVLPT